MEKYLLQLDKADSLSALNAIVQLAANDDSLTNEEYASLYQAALERVNAL